MTALSAVSITNSFGGQHVFAQDPAPLMGPRCCLESPSPTFIRTTVTTRNKGVLMLDHFKTYAPNVSVLQ